eukprot:2559279-Ditylum_brightwellii.AAC.1
MGVCRNLPHTGNQLTHPMFASVHAVWMNDVVEYLLSVSKFLGDSTFKKLSQPMFACCSMPWPRVLPNKSSGIVGTAVWSILRNCAILYLRTKRITRAVLHLMSIAENFASARVLMASESS